MNLAAIDQINSYPYAGKNQKSLSFALAIKPLIFLLLSLLFYLHVFALDNDHRVTIKGDNVSLEKIILEMKKQTGFFFLYENGILQSRKISVDLQDVLLEEALRQVLRGQFSFKVFDKTVVIRPLEEHGKSGATMIGAGSPASGVPISVQGTVINSEDQKPVDGATVQVKGTNKATYTNTQGKFTLDNVQDDATLVISRVSYATSEFKLNGNNSPIIPLVLEAGKLDEFIVTAYGQEKKEKEIGYSLSVIKGEELNQAHPMNVLSGLISKVPGLQLNTTTPLGIKPTIQIALRGIRSLSGDNTPLIVMDGSPIFVGADLPQNSSAVILNLLYSINPNDIESVTILRGANATILYGPSGVNGVIILNTKKGIGQANWNIGQTLTIQHLDMRYPKIQTLFGSGSTLNGFGDGVYNPTTNQSWGPTFTGGDSIIGIKDELGNYQRVPYRYTKDRFEFFQPAITSQTDVSFNAGDARSHYYLATQYANVQGMIPGDKSRRITIRFNGDRVYGIFKSAINFNFTKTNDDVSSSDVFRHVINNPANIPITKYENFNNDHWSDKFHYYSNDPTRPNPYEDATLYRNRTSSYALFGNLTFSIRPLKWLNLTNRAGISYNENNNEYHGSPVTGENFQKSYSTQTGISNDLLLKITLQWKKFQIDFLGGNTLTQATSKTLLNYFYGQLAVPNLFNLGFINGTANIVDTKFESRSISYLGNLNIGYKDWAFLELSYRNQRDSREGNGQAQESYYGANVSTVISNIFPSLTKNKVLSYLRIRVAYNKTANFNFSTYNGDQIFNILSGASGFPYGSLIGYQQSDQFQNSFTKPEKISSQEVGTEFRFMKDKISIDISHYFQYTRDLIQLLPIASSTGSNYLNGANAGNFKNWGWEITANLTPLFKLSNDFKGFLSANLAINENKVISLYQDVNILLINGGFAFVGKEAPIIGGRDYLRDSLGRVIVNAITGLPSRNSQLQYFGRVTPKYIMGLTFGLTWKKFSFKAVGEYRGGYDVNKAGAADQLDQLGISLYTAINERQRFVFPNSVYWDGNKYVPNTDIIVNNAGRTFFTSTTSFKGIASNYIVSGAFWKIREINFSYELPLKGKLIKRAIVSIFGRNLLNFYPKTNFWGDPELTANNFSTKFLGFNFNITL